MPNNVHQIVEVIGIPKEIDKFKMFLTNEKDEIEFDFSKLISPPDHIFQGDLGGREMELYGKNTWWNWNIENWGTKWNAYGVSYVENVLRFQTAWNEVPMLIGTLSMKFPKLKIIYKSNCEFFDKQNDVDFEFEAGRVVNVSKNMSEKLPEHDFIVRCSEIYDKDPLDYEFIKLNESKEYEFIEE